MNELWETIQPYVVAFAQTGLGTAIVYVICKLCVSRWFRKNDMNSLVNGFASKLVGSTINVDLTAVAEKKLAEIETRLMETNAPLVQSLEQVKHLVAMVGQALSRSRTLTEEERAALVEAVGTVEEGLKPIVKEEPIVITLQETTTEEPAKKNSTLKMG